MRFRATGATMALLTAVFVEGERCAAETVTAGNVLKAYQQKYQSIETISLQERITPRAIVPEKDLISDLGMMPLAPMSMKVVYHRDGRTYMWQTDPWDKAFDALVKKLTPEFPQLKRKPTDVYGVPYAKLSAAIQTVLDKVPPGELVLVFDGSRLWRHCPQDRAPSDGKRRSVFDIISTERAGGAFWFRSNLLDDALFAFPIRMRRDSERRQKHFLPDLLKGFSAEELSRPLVVENIANVPCVALSLKNQRFFLDSRFGFAVRRYEEASEGYTVRVYVADDFTAILAGVWLPRKVRDTFYGWPQQAKGKYAGKPLWEAMVDVTELEANKPDHLKHLRVEVPAGAVVIDQTLPAIDTQGKEVPVKTAHPNIVPTVSYVQPADKADIERVVRQAQIDAGQSPVQLDARPGGKAFWLWFNVGLVLVLTAAFVLRRLRRRVSGTRA